MRRRGLALVVVLGIVACARSNGISPPPLSNDDEIDADRSQALPRGADPLRGALMPSTFEIDAQAAAVPVAVGLIPRLPILGANAVVLRRRKQLPHDVILLSEHRLSVGVFGAAVHVLGQDERTRGVLPISDGKIAVTDSVEPQTWRVGTIARLARWELDSLVKRPLRTIEGVGAVRAIVIQLATPRR
jgi:hypothetical protein